MEYSTEDFTVKNISAEEKDENDKKNERKRGIIELINEYQETKSRFELKHEHGPKGGYVLHDHEFDRYKGWLSTLAAAAELEALFPELASGVKYTTQEFSKLLAERETFL